MLHVLLLLASLADLTAVSHPPPASAFASPVWVVGETDGFTGGVIFLFGLYSDGSAVYRDDSGNLVRVKLDPADRRALFRHLPMREFDRLPKYTSARDGDDCSTSWVVRWRKGVKREVSIEACTEHDVPVPFRVVFERFQRFRSKTSTVLAAARIDVVFTAKFAADEPFPQGWPEALPAPTRQGRQLSVVLDQSQIPAMRAFGKRLSPIAWSWRETPITPDPPHHELWAGDFARAFP